MLPSAEWALERALTTSLTDAGVTRPSADAWMPAYIGADEHRTERWTRGNDVVQVDRLLYFEQSQGKELVNSENHIAPDSLLADAALSPPLDASGRVVRTTLVRTTDGTRLVWYWYHVAGRDTPSETRAKLLELLAVATRASPSELVTVSTMCADASCTAARTALRGVVTGGSATE